MATQEVQEYYDATTNRGPRDDLVSAIQLTTQQGLAIDCGCGAGSDIAHLRQAGFAVQAFDVEQESIDRCLKRYGSDPEVTLTKASFASFEYPKADLVVADASLFFCPPSDFSQVWQKIVTALKPGAVFVGSFLGPRDTMATGQYDKAAFWPAVSTFTEPEIDALFKTFDVNKFHEHELDGKTAQGKDHHWHIFQVIAVRH